MTRHAVRTPRADRPLPVKTARALSAADREAALSRLLADVEERLEREECLRSTA
jgi:hypothetical protein